MIEVFKIVKGFGVVNFAGEKFLQIDAGPRRVRTRCHSLKLAKPRRRTLKRTKFLSRGVDYWNILLQEVVESHSISSSKNRYDQYMNRQ